MKCKITANAKGTILKISGNLKSEDDYSAFKNALDEIISASIKNIIIDMEELDYINSAGLGRLILSAKKVKKYNGSLKAIKLKAEMKDLFNITKLTEIIKVFETEEAALL